MSSLFADIRNDTIQICGKNKMAAERDFRLQNRTPPHFQGSFVKIIRRFQTDLEKILEIWSNFRII